MLPAVGYIRLVDIIGDRKRGIPAIIPISQAAWYAGVKAGLYPAGILIGPRTRAWSVDSIRELIKRLGE